MTETQVRIVVLDRGYIFAAYTDDPTDNVFWLKYRNRKTIRVWGTTKGLAELLDGPTDGTKLDEICDSGSCPVKAIIDVMNCTEKGNKAWSKVLK